MSITKNNLQDAARKVSDLAEILKKSIDGGFHDGEVIEPPDARLAALLVMCTNPKGALPTFLGMLGAPAPPPAPAVESPTEKVELSFEDFLGSVGRAMLDAQKQLDAQSSQYLTGIQNQPHIAPSVFRMPKLSGTMKFAVGKSSSNQMNLVFYSSGSQESSQHQQEIQFEMVSAPAPLQALGALRQKAPRLDLVLDPAERNPVLAAAKLSDSVVPDAVLVLRVEAGRTYLLLNGDGTQAVGAASVRDAVQQVAARQEDFLKLLGG
jgi:hypothetical protein